MKDGDETALLFTQDINYTTNTISPELRLKLWSQTGVPQENISFASTGTYGGPEIKNTADSVIAWKIKYETGVLEAARQAQEDLWSLPLDAKPPGQPSATRSIQKTARGVSMFPGGTSLPK